MKGFVFDIQRNSLNDGPGIRTTVFLKGCSLNCIWCHNRESVYPLPQLRFLAEKCIHCMECVKVCKANAHLNSSGMHVVGFDKCILNRDCLEVCPSGALKITGDALVTDEIIQIVLKDRDYYKNSGGGMTLSGGEPMVQFEFSLELLRKAKQEGIETCLDTTGNAPWSDYEKVMPFTDIFLYDYKESDPDNHLKFTGVKNDLILENLERLNSEKATIILRCPIIPGVNDREDHFRSIASIAGKLHSITEVTLLPYHSMGIGKAQQHGIKAIPKEFSTPSEEKKSQWKKLLEEFGVKNVSIF